MGAIVVRPAVATRSIRCLHCCCGARSPTPAAARDRAHPGREVTRRLGLQAAAAVAIALVARTIAYALSPSPTAEALGGQLGGPHLVVVGGVTLGLAAGASLLLIGLTAAMIGERSRLAHVTEAPRLDARGIPLRALGLFGASAFLFAIGESTIHWHAGYGFHPQHCLTGPVHENAVPILAALAAVTSVAIAVADRLRAWAHRTLRQAVLVDGLVLAFPAAAGAMRPALPLVVTLSRDAAPRGPPALH